MVTDTLTLIIALVLTLIAALVWRACYRRARRYRLARRLEAIRRRNIASDERAYWSRIRDEWGGR